MIPLYNSRFYSNRLYNQNLASAKSSCRTIGRWRREVTFGNLRSSSFHRLLTHLEENSNIEQKRSRITFYKSDDTAVESLVKALFVAADSISGLSIN